ncbi:NAD(P)-binding protein [Nemania serpens]|nr:NAD(P)-binding protein [Nemania serpens]
MALVVLISGVSKGIGKGFAQAYLSRPNHIVIGTIRESAASSPEVKGLESFPAADGSRLLLVRIESTSPTDAATALQTIRDAGINHLDIVIANAGGSPIPTTPLESVAFQEMTTTYQVNASPKWASISTGGGSITLMGTIRSWDGSSYAAAKAALNWITRAIHFSNEWLVAVALNPGLVQTGPGNWIAKEWGLGKATYTIEESVEGMMKVIDGATREEASGKFLRMNGTELPW